jgi:hypothetical protein
MLFLWFLRLFGFVLVSFLLLKVGLRGTYTPMCDCLSPVMMFKMNGAELPCGAVLKVEPSDPLYQIRKKKQTNYYGRGSREEPAEEPDDLDDFFESLT